MSAKRALPLTPLQIFSLALGGALAALLLAELGTRVFSPSTSLERQVLQVPYDGPRYLLDSQNGYLPHFEDSAPAPGFAYDSKGVNRDLSIRLGEGGEKILFLGNSLIRRGDLLQALSQAYAGNQWQLLNAGVDGYNLAQAANYFRRFASANEPSRLVIALDEKDFSPSLTLHRENGFRMFWYAYGEQPLPFNLRLFHWSALYRKWVTARYDSLVQKAQARNPLPRASRTALAELKDWCEITHAKLQAIVLPPGRGPSEMTAEEKSSRELALQIMKELKIETFAPVLDGGRTGATSPDTAQALAAELKKEGFFRDLSLAP